MAFLSDVVGNITTLVAEMGNAGLSGLIALGAVLFLYNKKIKPHLPLMKDKSGIVKSNRTRARRLYCYRLPFAKGRLRPVCPFCCHKHQPVHVGDFERGHLGGRNSYRFSFILAEKPCARRIRRSSVLTKHQNLITPRNTMFS